VISSAPALGTEFHVSAMYLKYIGLLDIFKIAITYLKYNEFSYRHVTLCNFDLIHLSLIYGKRQILIDRELLIAEMAGLP
jgi:hypothetical protein